MEPTTEQPTDHHPELDRDTPDHTHNPSAQNTELGDRYYWLDREVNRG